MVIEPYKSFGPLRFGATTRDECVALLGRPRMSRINRKGLEEYHYDNVIVRFALDTHLVHECTILPEASATVGNIKLTWDKVFLKRACEQDGAPLDIYGFIVLNRLGITVAGIHDEDKSQLAVSVYSKGALDDLLPEAVPFDASSL